MSGSPKPTHDVDVTPVFDRAVASLAAHEESASLRGNMADPEGFLRTHAERAAQDLPGATLATSFELLELLSTVVELARVRRAPAGTGS